MKLIKFYSQSCMPCKAMTPIVAKASETLDLELENVDVEVNAELTAKYNVRGVPTVVLLDDDNEVVAKFIGMKPNLIKELESYV